MDIGLTVNNTYYISSAFTSSSPLLFPQHTSHKLDPLDNRGGSLDSTQPTQKYLHTKIFLSYVGHSWSGTDLFLKLDLFLKTIKIKNDNGAQGIKTKVEKLY